jgi:flagellar assembly protein FliH
MDNQPFSESSSGDPVDSQRVDLTDVLARTKKPDFARTDNKLQPQAAPFRRLSWIDIAIQVPQEPELIEDYVVEPHISAEQNLPTTNPESLIQEAPTAQPPEPAHQEAESSGDEDVLELKPTDPPEPAIDEKMLQSIRDDAYAEGLSAGKAMTENEREAELSVQYTQLQRLISSLSSDKVVDMDIVTQSIRDAVLSLASDRIGLEITDMPDPLLVRFETMLNNLSHLVGKREVFVSPDDVPILQKCLSDQPNPPLIHLQGEPELLRGDVRVRVGGAEVTDLLRDRAQNFFNEKTSEVL